MVFMVVIIYCCGELYEAISYALGTGMGERGFDDEWLFQ